MLPFLYPGMELTFAYENKIYRTMTEAQFEQCTLKKQIKIDQKDVLYVGDDMGGCVPVRDCKCGYPFCCGDMATRYYNEKLRDEDYYLLIVLDSYVYILIGRLYELNRDYCQQFPDRFLARAELTRSERADLILKRYCTESMRDNAMLAQKEIRYLTEMYTCRAAASIKNIK